MNKRGVVFVMVLAVMIVLISLVGGFLYATSVLVLNSGWEETDAKVLWLAEAGLQKGIWNLKTPAGSGGQGETWTTAGTTENLGDGSYTMVVTRSDFALSDNGSTATASSSSPGAGPSKAIDGNDATRWKSDNVPSAGSPESITVAFPYPLTINKVRFFLASSFSANRPVNYTWAVSSDGTNFTTVVTVTGSGATDQTDTFSAQSNVTHLRLQVTATGGTNKVVNIGTLEAIGSKITSTGSIIQGGNTISRTVSQTVVTDDASPQNQVAYYQPDWAEQ